MQLKKDGDVYASTVPPNNKPGNVRITYHLGAFEQSLL